MITHHMSLHFDLIFYVCSSKLIHCMTGIRTLIICSQCVDFRCFRNCPNKIKKSIICQPRQVNCAISNFQSFDMTGPSVPAVCFLLTRKEFNLRYCQLLPCRLIQSKKANHCNIQLGNVHNTPVPTWYKLHLRQYYCIIIGTIPNFIIFMYQSSVKLCQLDFGTQIGYDDWQFKYTTNTHHLTFYGYASRYLSIVAIGT